MQEIKPRQLWRQKSDENTWVQVMEVTIEGNVIYHTFEKYRAARKSCITSEAHFRQLFAFAPLADDLDAKWSELAKTDSFVNAIEEKYQRTIQEAEALLMTLREYARRAF